MSLYQRPLNQSKLDEWTKWFESWFSSNPAANKKLSAVSLTTPEPADEPSELSGTGTSDAPQVSSPGSSGRHDVARHLKEYMWGRGKEQAAFERVINLLILAHDGAVGTIDGNLDEKVMRVQAINDCMSDDEAIKWYTRALELSL